MYQAVYLDLVIIISGEVCVMWMDTKVKENCVKVIIVMIVMIIVMNKRMMIAVKLMMMMMMIIPGEVLMDMKETEEKQQKLRLGRTSSLVLALHLFYHYSS